ncbi:MAG: hypothetical protein MK187_04945 [Acidimicrobiales bacterium]|nr:hypothetical protein [Acidimicrobiales bacterium]
MISDHPGPRPVDPEVDPQIRPPVAGGHQQVGQGVVNPSAQRADHGHRSRTGRHCGAQGQFQVGLVLVFWMALHLPGPGDGG